MEDFMRFLGGVLLALIVVVPVGMLVAGGFASHDSYTIEAKHGGDGYSPFPAFEVKEVRRFGPDRPVYWTQDIGSALSVMAEMNAEKED